MSTKKQRRLPDGTWTTSTAKYTRVWGRLMDAGERILGLQQHGFNPGLSFHSEMPCDPIVRLSPATMERLIKLETAAIRNSLTTEEK